jgi:predicted nucleic acid-binding protein
LILLDTNVLSALMQREPDAAVVGWLDSQSAESIWTTSITVFEVRTGLELLEAGNRRRALQRAFDQLLAGELDGRVQSFDQSAAVAAGTIAADRQRAGRTLEVRDVQIAGIALARKATLATRNLRHFEGLGVDLVDPWSVAGSAPL